MAGVAIQEGRGGHYAESVSVVQVTNTNAKQMELDRIAEDFKALHAERQQLVRQWQETIEAMKRRDQEINEIGKALVHGQSLMPLLLPTQGILMCITVRCRCQVC